MTHLPSPSAPAAPPKPSASPNLTTAELRALRRGVGLQIQEARFVREMYLHELAAATGLSQRLLANYEMGKDIITLDSLAKIAAALKTSVGQLVVPIPG